MNNPVRIYTFHAHTCAITTAAKAYCWGSSNFGQLGDKLKLDRNTPVEVTITGAQAIKQLALGLQHTCALTTDDEAYCWGRNAQGQLGNGSNTDESAKLGAAIGTFTAIESGSIHMCGITASQGVMCWGANSHGQLGDGTTTANNKPVLISGVTGAQGLGAGDLHTCAWLSGGAVACWGGNASRQLGDPAATHLTQPKQVINSGASYLAVGGSHSCAILEGSAKCWGSNGAGQLGNDSTTNSAIPVEIPNLD